MGSRGEQEPDGRSRRQVVITLDAHEVADLRAGSDYMDVHSSGFSGGEIQGQLMWNPLEEAKFFVNQAYFDFLSRTPDADGMVPTENARHD
ncbi:MAG: hypothetical protein JWM21_4693 [Acidobacteria bacterium]|nr:hypothetical protein [Acidobacteriota bacterium]